MHAFLKNATNVYIRDICQLSDAFLRTLHFCEILRGVAYLVRCTFEKCKVAHFKYTRIFDACADPLFKLNLQDDVP